MPEPTTDHSCGARPRWLAGTVCAALLIVLMAQLLGVPTPACACTTIVPATRDVLHEAFGIYEATALADSIFEVDRIWRGESYRELIVPFIGEEQIEFCTAQEPIVPKDRYLVFVFCPEPVEVFDGDEALFECEARADALSRSEVFLEALGRGTVVGRADLIDALRLWQSGLDPVATYDWLVEADKYAEVDDWETDEDGYNYSLTGGLISELVDLVEQVLDCAPDGAERSAHFETLRVAVLPALIDLLESSSPPSEDELDALEDFFMDYEVDC